MKPAFVSYYMVATLGIALLLCTVPVARAQSHARKDRAAPVVKVTASGANKIALKKFGGKVVGKTPLENEEGKWQYGVMVSSGKTLREVMVNAMTGKIDSVEVTTKATEIREKAGEKDAKHGKEAVPKSVHGK